MERPDYLDHIVVNRYRVNQGSWAFATRISVCHCGSELIHCARRVRRERSFHLREVHIGLLSFKTIRCVSRVLSSASHANRHLNESIAPSKLISLVAAVGGVTSRISHCSGS